MQSPGAGWTPGACGAARALLTQTGSQGWPLQIHPLIALIQSPAGSGDDPGALPAGLVGQCSARCPWGLWGQGFQPGGMFPSAHQL